MKHLFSLFWLTMFAATTLTLVLSACGKEETANPSPTTGTVTGQLTPATAVITVTATSTTTPATTATATPTASGAYTFSTLAPGSYTLSFTPAMGYAAPATQTVAVTAGATVTATPVTVTASLGGPSSGARFTYTLNGTATTANLVSANVVFGSLFVQSSSNQGSQLVTLSLEPVPTGPRSYSFGGAGSTSEITVTEVASSSLAEWSTSAPAGTGTVTITAVSTNPRRVSGTFSAGVPPRGATASGQRTLTAGSFSNLAF